ncbi:MAG: asparagine synthase (glutamine-hydrolyzing) [Paraglaciecola sp.]|jgi:asparagine synthase (glutamine-hydrolysing)
MPTEPFIKRLRVYSMCGITGFIHFANKKKPDLQLVEQMNQAQLHRGPDEGSVYANDILAFGHRRLSIIDVSTGQQPLKSACGHAVIVFNGEIYNYKTLREQLKNAGFVFNTHSDTEVIINGWLHWGPSVVDHLDGMFAFAIWDERMGKVFVARDRLGIKPLFYANFAGSFYFASELKGIMPVPGLDKSIDHKALEQYMALGYIPEPFTIYNGAHKLEPGHWLEIEVGKQDIRKKQYWDVSYAKQRILTEEQYLDELTDNLKSCVSSHLVSEVPLGAFLSGGVDSSAVVAMMAQQTSTPVKTCTIGFAAKEYNESDFAQQVADRYKTDHTVKFLAADDFKLVDELIDLYDEPYADSSAMPTYRVCELAREKVTVALSGDGPDELLAGYRRYKMFMGEQKVRKYIPEFARKAIFKPLGHLYPKMDWAPQFLRAKATFQSLALNMVDGYCQGVSFIKPWQRSQLYSNDFKAKLGGYDAVEVFRNHAKNFDGKDPLSLLQYLDIKTYLVGDILTKVDRASMAHSLEVRVPFLDHKFVEWTASVPAEYRLRSGEGKYLLKKAMEAHLPPDIMYRKKMGFRIPLEHWFRNDLKDVVKQRLLSEHMADSGLFNMDYINRLVSEHQSGVSEHSAALWSLLMFEGFYKKVA